MAKKMKKLFSLILALIMVLSLLSANAFAVKSDGHLSADTKSKNDYIEVDGVKYHVHYDTCFPLTCLICGKQTHSHEAGCYGEDILACEKTVDLTCDVVDHEHDGDCYVSHEHAGDCWMENVTCGIEAHAHTMDCYVAGHKVNSKGNPSHSVSGGCYDTLAEPVCGWEAATADMICELDCLESRTPDVRDISKSVTPGEAPYVFHFRYTYQYSVHQSRYLDESKEATPQVFLLVNTVDEEFADGTWIPNGADYDPSVSNYTLAYCCDMLTSINGAYYRQINLEDAGYYTEDEAKNIRAIVLNSYPFISFDEMLQDMYDAGAITEADKAVIDYSDVLAAVQFAIWSYSNMTDINAEGYKSSIDENMVYDGVHYAGSSIRTATTSDGIYKAYLSEASAHNPVNSSYNFFYPEVSSRIEKIKDYLFGLTPVEEAAAEIIISDVEVKELQYVADGSGSYTAKLKVALNAGCDENDDIAITAKNLTTGASVSVPVGAGSEYVLELAANMEDKIEVGVAGTQVLEKGVYFFEPEATDADGDGVATTRETSQNLVGYAAGPVPVGDAVVLDAVDVTLKKVNESGNALTGAEFALSHAGIEIDTYAVDENGEVVISGLMPGVTYELKETKAPDGYVALSEPVKFVVSGNETLEIKLVNNPDDVRCETNDDEYILTVVNCPEPPTPPTPPTPTTTSVTVNKVWAGDNETIRPDSIEVQLYANGVAYGSAVTLDESNGWSYTWYGLPIGGAYTVDEVSVPEGYVKSVSGYTITNTYSEEEIFDEDPPLAGGNGGMEEEIFDEDVPLADVPATGDMTALWIAASAVSAAGVLFLSKKSKEEE